MTKAFARAAGIAVVVAATSADATSPREQMQAENCREAAGRYHELYGQTVADEQHLVVLMYKHTFCPPALTVRRGTVIRFLNVDRRTSHSFWFRDAGRPESDRYFPGEGTTLDVDLPPGEHIYLCGPHWENEGMTGTLTVLP
jgi:plastocyanin